MKNFKKKMKNFKKMKNIKTKEKFQKNEKFHKVFRKRPFNKPNYLYKYDLYLKFY